jgi:dipeptidase E
MKAFLTSHNLKAEHFEAFTNLIGANKVTKALFITTAAVPYGFSPKPVWLEESLDAFRPYADSIDEIDLEDGETAPEDLSQYGFIFVTGGNTFYLAYRFSKTGFDKKIKEYIANGGVYSGSSAGSIILMDNIEHFAPADDPKEAPEMCPGLGLIDIAIIPHTDSEKYKDLMEGIAKKYEAQDHKTIRLNDDQVLLIKGDETKVI